MRLSSTVLCSIFVAAGMVAAAPTPAPAAQKDIIVDFWNKVGNSIRDAVRIQKDGDAELDREQYCPFYHAWGLNCPKAEDKKEQGEQEQDERQVREDRRRDGA